MKFKQLFIYKLPVSLLIFLGGMHFLFASTPTVPSVYKFADMTLVIKESARKQIQADVDALYRYPSYLEKKIAKIDMYFPIIERIFREENLPDDFKYLCVQESSLVPDAVSSSNAVGFWQFKEDAAREVGLRIDRYIDERMSINASTRGAARYLKKHNSYFDNWIYSLLAYNTGRGGAESYVERKYFSSKKMEINKHTHWYVKRFLAHKIAFENVIGKNHGVITQLGEFTKAQNKSLEQIAGEFELNENDLIEYNKWLKKGKVPDDKEYTVIIPIESDNSFARSVLLDKNKNGHFEKKNRLNNTPVIASGYALIKGYDFSINNKFPRIKSNKDYVKINNIHGVVASDSDNMYSLLQTSSITQDKFLKYNDMTATDHVASGQVYYFKKKKNKAQIHYHVVMPGESAWAISQKYGIRLKKLLSKNRLKNEKDIKPGMVLWLRFIRPANVPVEYREIDVNNVIVTSTPNDITLYKENSATKTSIITEKAAPSEESQTEEDEFKTKETMVAPEPDTEHDFILSEENITESSEKTDDTPAPDTKSSDFDENMFFTIENGEEVIVDENTSGSQSGQRNSIDFEVKNNSKYHIVKPKETLSEISRIYGIPISQLYEWNNINSTEILHVGQKLIIQQSVPEEIDSNIMPKNQGFIVYVVRPNDTLYSIARKHDVTIKELMEWNSKDNFEIKENEELKIKLK